MACRLCVRSRCLYAHCLYDRCLYDYCVCAPAASTLTLPHPYLLSRCMTSVCAGCLQAYGMTIVEAAAFGAPSVVHYRDIGALTLLPLHGGGGGGGMYIYNSILYII